MRHNDIARVVLLGVSLSLLPLFHACTPRSPDGFGQGSSRAISLPQNEVVAGGRSAAHREANNASLNTWSDAARDILVRHCGECHRGDLPTAVPGALAVFDVLEDPWYGRLAPKQFDGVLLRIRGTRAIDPVDADTMEQFVRCARDAACEAHQK